jgi:hypothetical protein
MENASSDPLKALPADLETLRKELSEVFERGKRPAEGTEVRPVQEIHGPTMVIRGK